jgi:hypothetical protein
MKKTLRLFLFALSTAFILTTQPAFASIEFSQAWNGNIIIKARDSILVEVFTKLREEYAVEVAGLESRKSDKITFTFEAKSLEDLLRGLLRYLGVKNFAIEFADATLKRIVVVPDSVLEISPTKNMPSEQSDQTEYIGVAQVQSIVEFSQADSLDLIAGDIILEYDGVRITSAQQLVDEVKNKDENSQVEMVILRSNYSKRLILAGGMIGVRVLTKQIPKQDILSLD